MRKAMSVAVKPLSSITMVPHPVIFRSFSGMDTMSMLEEELTVRAPFLQRDPRLPDTNV